MPPARSGSVLAFLRRNGTAIVASSALIGLVFPDLAAAARPTIGWLIVVLLALAFLQVDPVALARRLKAPRRALAADAWICLALPGIVLGAATLIGIGESDPELLVILFLVTAPTPLISAPTLAAMMGLDAALVLAIVLFANLLVPLTAPLVASLFIGPDLPLSPVDLALRLALIVGAAFAVSAAVRRLAGPARVAAGKPVFDGLAIVALIWFGVGAMDGVRAATVERPAMMAGLLALAFALAFGQMALTYLVFRRAFGPDAAAIAYAAGNRNMGVLIAALGIMGLPDRVWLFFALAQVPIFTLPLLLKGLVARLGGAGRVA